MVTAYRVNLRAATLSSYPILPLAKQELTEKDWPAGRVCACRAGDLALGRRASGGGSRCSTWSLGRLGWQGFLAPLPDAFGTCTHALAAPANAPLVDRQIFRRVSCLHRVENPRDADQRQRPVQVSTDSMRTVARCGFALGRMAPRRNETKRKPAANRAPSVDE
jgi:hypothetical protein